MAGTRHPAWLAEVLTIVFALFIFEWVGLTVRIPGTLALAKEGGKAM